MGLFFHHKPDPLMKRKPLLLALLLAPGITYAALPPQYQNTKDLDVIVEFIKQHERILATLESIDFENYTVHYSNGCVATFERKGLPKPPGWVGPADPLVFKKSTCPIDP
ncbi:MAG: hypothetical protein ACOY3Z_01950 [Thermodesulfobacteriota bacterium]